MGSVAFSSLIAQETPTGPLSPKRPMRTAKAKNVIYLFMGGAPSHLDLFDNKPEPETAQDKSDDALNKFPSHEPGIGTEMSDKEFAQLLDNSLKGKSINVRNL